ncbi:MAG: pentapeptide repeat protein, partial [Caulobacteraceae bacterium]|nr:pentapeptide repeat protein [Caulobacteraceae bacterium]
MQANSQPSASARRRVTQAELDLLIDAHERLMAGKPSGRRLSLKFCDLSGLNLAGRNLSDADLS